jgi:dCMP deaminase
MMKPKFVDLYSDIADRVGQMSHATRAKVGAVIVKDDTIISYGYNGMPRGWPNDCEIDGATRPEVLHAESNAIAKLARGPASGFGADMFVSYSPCIECAKLIAQTGIRKVWYRQQYRDTAGIDFLRHSSIEVVQKPSD